MILPCPYVISIMKTITINGYEGTVIVNLNLHKLKILTAGNSNGYQNNYIITDKSQVIFRNGQRDILEELTIVKELENFDPTQKEASILVENRTQPYTYAQVKSKDYNWSYISITHLQEYTYKLSSQKALIAVISLMFVIMSISVALLFSFSASKPVRDIMNLLDDPNSWYSLQNKSTHEIKYIAERIVSYIQTNDTLSKELDKRLELLNKTQIKALQLQINPHFLFNTLNMIHLMATEEFGYKHPVSIIAVNLGKLLQYALESGNLVTLKTELDSMANFIAILNYRYNNLFKTDLSIDPAVTNAKIPRLVLQPIIENAVFHGIAKSENPNHILTICASRKTVDLHGKCINAVALMVNDTGSGMDSDTLTKLKNYIENDTISDTKHIGIKNVIMRMRLLFGSDIDVHIKSKPNEGTCFSLIFPYIE